MYINKFNEYLLELVRETSEELLKIYFNKPHRKTLLKFPQYRNGKIRISEQELRFVMINLHEQFSSTNFYYSVETPTENKYAFSENARNKRSASSDLSFYNGDSKVMNVELKAHNATQYSINKDIQKLTKEDYNGAWIHLFKNEDRGTIKRLFNKLNNGFDKFQHSKKQFRFLY